jgi:hypothetical protein
LPSMTAIRAARRVTRPPRKSAPPKVMEEKTAKMAAVIAVPVWPFVLSVRTPGFRFSPSYR